MRVPFLLATLAALGVEACFLLVDTDGLEGAKRDPNDASPFGDGAAPASNTDAARDAPRVEPWHVLATGLLTPIALAVTPTDVLVATRGNAAVMTVSKAGGTPTVLDSLGRVGAGPMTVGVDGDAVFWTAVGDTDCCGRLRRALQRDAGQSVEVGVELGGTFVGLAQDPTFVYASAGHAQSEGYIRVWRKSDAQLIAVRGVPVEGPIAVDATDVYFVTGPNEIRRIGRAGIEGDAGTGDPFSVSPTLPASMVIDETHVYWSLDLSGTILRQAKATPSATPTPIVSGVGSPGIVVLYGDFAYWTDGVSRSIRRAPKVGGTVETIAGDQDSPSSLAVDDSGVYWTTLATGTLVTAPFASP